VNGSSGEAKSTEYAVPQIERRVRWRERQIERERKPAIKQNR
jgi:hypothetical protein